jgi:hypothetical protein
MRKQAEAHCAPWPTFAAILANFTASASFTPSSKFPPKEFSRMEVTDLPASFAVLLI